MLDLFALLILLVLLVAFLIVIGVLGALPGYIARKRGHPQADAIHVGGWVGLLFGGVLWPLALIWAYTRSTGDGFVPASNPNNGGKP